MRNKMNKLALMAATMCAGGFGANSYSNLFSESPKPKKVKCKIPTCENLTSHKKGYCSATCFKASK